MPSSGGAVPLQDAEQLLALQDLVLEEVACDGLELRATPLEDPARALERARDQRLHLLLDLTRRRLARRERAGFATRLQEAGLLPRVRDRAERLGHAELADHAARELRRPLEVVARAGRDLAEDDVLGRAPAQQHRQ